MDWVDGDYIELATCLPQLPKNKGKRRGLGDRVGGQGGVLRESVV